MQNVNWMSGNISAVRTIGSSDSPLGKRSWISSGMWSCQNWLCISREIDWISLLAFSFLSSLIRGSCWWSVHLLWSERNGISLFFHTLSRFRCSVDWHRLKRTSLPWAWPGTLPTSPAQFYRIPPLCLGCSTGRVSRVSYWRWVHLIEWAGVYGVSVFSKAPNNIRVAGWPSWGVWEQKGCRD